MPVVINVMGSDQVDTPPFIRIGAVMGLVAGLATVAVVHECPSPPSGLGTVDSVSFGPSVRVVISDSPQIEDADARMVRKAGERDVIVFWTSALTPRSLCLALHRLDDIRGLTGDSAFRSLSFPFRAQWMEMALARNPAHAEAREFQDAAGRQCASVHDDLMSRRNSGPMHSEPGIGAGVYVDIVPLRHRRVLVKR
jgi:hypothetical protein